MSAGQAVGGLTSPPPLGIFTPTFIPTVFPLRPHRTDRVGPDGVEYVEVWVPEDSMEEPGANPPNRRVGGQCGVAMELGVWAPGSPREVEADELVGWGRTEGKEEGSD